MNMEHVEKQFNEFWEQFLIQMKAELFVTSPDKESMLILKEMMDSEEMLTMSRGIFLTGYHCGTQYKESNETYRNRL